MILRVRFQLSFAGIETNYLDSSRVIGQSPLSLNGIPFMHAKMHRALGKVVQPKSRGRDGDQLVVRGASFRMRNNRNLDGAAMKFSNLLSRTLVRTKRLLRLSCFILEARLLLQLEEHLCLRQLGILRPPFNDLSCLRLQKSSPRNRLL